MNGGFETPIGLGIPGTPVGIGLCSPGYRCVGPSALGVCLGTCVPTGSVGGPYTPDYVQPPGQPGKPEVGGVVYGKLQPKRRRMNYSNQKALRRALRRATGYARQQKAVRKAAQEFAREFGPKRSRPRRDLGRGHEHVR